MRVKWEQQDDTDKECIEDRTSSDVSGLRPEVKGSGLKALWPVVMHRKIGIA